MKRKLTLYSVPDGPPEPRLSKEDARRLCEPWDGTREGTDRFFKGVAWCEPILAELLMQAWKRFPAHLAFEAYSTHGLPLDLTVAHFEAQGWTVDTEGFDKLMELDREKSRQGSKFNKQIFG